MELTCNERDEQEGGSGKDWEGRRIKKVVKVSRSTHAV